MRKFLSVLLAVMMVLSSVSFAAPMAFTGADSAEELPFVENNAEVFEETVGELSVEDYFNEDYGTLVAEVNFDSTDAATTDFTGYSAMNVSNLGGRVNSDLTSLSTSLFRFRNNVYSSFTKAVASVVTDGTNKYISYSGPADTGTNQQWIMQTNNGSDSFANTDGNLVVTADLLLESDAVTDNPFSFVFNHTNGSVACEDAGRTVQRPVKGSWSTMVAEYGDAATLDKVANSSGYYVNSITEINQVKFNPNVNMGSDVIGIDNVRMYWLPKTVNITVDFSAYGVANQTFEFDTIGKSASDLLAKLTAVEGLDVVGLSRTNGGAAIEGNYIRFTQDTTLYPVTSNVLAKYSSEFKSKDDLNATIAAYTRLPAPTYNDGYITFDLTDNTYNYYFTIPGLGGEATAADNIEIPKGTLEKMEMRLRFRNVPDSDVTFTAYNSSTQTFSKNSGYSFTMYYTNSTTTTIGGKSKNTPTFKIGDHIDEWFTLTLSGSDLGNASDVISGIRMQGVFPLASGMKMDIDYIRFIGNDTVPGVNVTVDYSAVASEGKTDVVKRMNANLDTIGDLIAALDVSSERKIFKGLSATKGGEVLSEDTLISGETTYYTVWENNPYYGQYGELIFELDFENLSVGDVTSTIIKYNSNTVSTIGGRVNPSFNTSTLTAGIYRNSDDTTTTAQIKNNATQGNYLEFTMTNSPKSNSTIIWAMLSGTNTLVPASKENGTLIATYDLLIDSGNSSAGAWKPCFNSEPAIGKEIYGTAPVAPAKGTWGTVVSSFGKDQITADGTNKITSICDISRLKIFKPDATVTSGTYAVDNIRLWWVPESVNVTLNYNENTADGLPESQTFEISPSISYADLAAMITDTAGMEIVGFKDEDGVVHAVDNSSLSFMYDTTLDIVWQVPNVLATYSSEFTNADELNAVPFNPSGTLPSPKYENGYISYVFTNGTYNPHFQVPGLGQMSDDVEIPVGLVKKYEFRIRFRNFPTTTTTFTEGSNTRTFNPAGNIQLGTYISNNQYTSWTDNCVVRKSTPFVPNEWLTYSFTGSEIKNDANVVDGMRFGFEFAIPAGSIVDIDYIRFVGVDSAKQVDVTIDYSDINAAGFSNNTETKVLAGSTSVGDLMNMIGTTVAGKTLMGLSLTENGALLSESMMIEEDVYLYCVWQAPNILEEYSSEFTSATSLNSAITSIDSQYTGGYYTRSYNEDGYLRFEFNVGEGYCVYNPWFVVPGLGGNADDIQIGAGELDYVEVRIRYNGFVPGTYVQKSNNTSRSASATQNSPFFYYTTDTKTTWGAASYSASMDLVSNGGKWLTLTIPADKLSNNTNPLNGIRYDLPHVCNNGSSIDIDYIRFIGQKKQNVTVTVDFTDVNAAEFDDKSLTVPAGTAVSAILAQLDVSTAGKKLLGLSKTEGGEVLAQTAAIDDTCTLYAVWEDLYILGSFGSEFNEATAVTYGNLSSVSFNENGYLTMNYVSNGKGTGYWDSRLTVPGITDATPIKAGTADYIEMRIRYNGLETTNGSFVCHNGNTNKWNSSNTSLPFFFYRSTSVSKLGDANYKVDYNLTNASVASLMLGKWIIVKMPASTFNMDNDDLFELRFDAPDYVPFGATIDIDYIRVVGKGNFTSAPTTLPGKTGLRADPTEDGSTFDANGYNGLRYMASVNYDTDKYSDEIGWLVTTEKYWVTDKGNTAADLDITDVVAGSSKVKVGYKRAADLEKEIGYFEMEDDETLIYSAVLFGVPLSQSKSKIIVRPFVSFNGEYSYGEAMTVTMYDVAYAIKNGDNYEYCSQPVKDYIDYILGGDEFLNSEANLNTVMATPSTVASNLILPVGVGTSTAELSAETDTVSINVWNNSTGKFEDITVFNLSGSEKVVENGVLNSQFKDHLCIYYYDSAASAYQIRSLGYSEYHGEHIGIEKKKGSVLDSSNANAMFFGDLTSSEAYGQIQRKNSDDNSYYLGETLAFDSVLPTSISKVIVKTTFTNSDDVEYVTYSGVNAVHYLSTLPASKLEYVAYNDTSSTSVESLLALYAEVEFDDSHSNNIEVFNYTVGASISGSKITTNNFSVRNASVNKSKNSNLLSGVTCNDEAVSVTTSSSDNGIVLNDISVDANTHKRVRARFRVTSGTFGTNAGNFFYMRNGDTSFNTNTNRYYSLPAFMNTVGVDEEGWYIIDIDLGDYVRWNGTITDFRFDFNANSGVKYEVDYIRFIKTSDYTKLTTSQLEATYGQGKSLILDPDYENGFAVMPIENTSYAEGYFETAAGNSTTDNKWLIGPWWTHNQDPYDTNTATNRLIPAQDGRTVAGTTLASSDGSVAVSYDASTKALSMTLNGSKIYKGANHVGNWHVSRTDEENMAVTTRKWWPHLLIEQNPNSFRNTNCDFKSYKYDANYFSADAERIYCDMDIALTDFEIVGATTDVEGEYEFMSYLAYFYLVSDNYPGKRIWFGLNLMHSATAGYGTTWAPDSAALLYMYAVPAELIYEGMENSFFGYYDANATHENVASNTFKSLHIDLTPHIDKAVEWANAYNAFGGPVTKDELYFGGMNLGFETHGNVDATVVVKNFDLVAYN